MTTVFPGAIDALPRPSSTDTMDDPGFEGDVVIDNISDAIEAIEGYLQKNTRTNRLINGRMRIQQRSTLGSTDNTYTLDRWRILLEAANAAAAAQETSDVPTDGSKRALSLTVGSGEDNKFGIFQVIENVDTDDLRGKTISLQAKLKATAAITDVRMAVLEWTGTADAVSGDPVSSWGSAGTNPTLATNWAYLGTPANLGVTTSWATYKVEGLTVGSSMNNLAVMIWCEDESTTVTTDVLRITDVQLEEGPKCGDIDRRHISLEQILCERYLERRGGETSTETLDLARSSSSTQATVVWKFRVKKRTTPTITVSAAGDWAASDGGGVQTATSINFNGQNPNSTNIDVNVASGMTAGRCAIVFANSTSNARFYADAEL